MLARLQLELKPEDQTRITWQKAVLLQSILMEQAGTEYAQELHKPKLHPYSQSVIHQDGKNIWTICTTNEEAYEQLILPLQSSKFKEIFLEHDNQKVSVGKKELLQMEMNEFMEQYYFTDSRRYITVRFETPTAFKSQGAYIYYPNLQFIYQSLMNKYDAASRDETVVSEEVLAQLVSSGKVIHYNLRSCSYSVHGAKIPAFSGQITIRMHGPQAMVNFANMLFHFGEYSGVGIKTAMGMGKIKIIEKVEE